MANIFKSVARHFGPKEHVVNPRFDPTIKSESNKHLVVFGESVLFFDNSKPGNGSNWYVL
jgi:hypothetical protein